MVKVPPSNPPLVGLQGLTGKCNARLLILKECGNDWYLVGIVRDLCR